MKELSIEEKSRRYDEALERARKFATDLPNGRNDRLYHVWDLECIFPELKEINDETIRKDIISYLAFYKDAIGEEYESWIAWLEKQDENNKWKPSKDEMDALYGLAYITNKIDDKKDEAITKLYQDLKREFFSGVSYENMFPSSPVDSSIKLEKQSEQKDILKNAILDGNEDGLVAETIHYKKGTQGEQKPVNVDYISGIREELLSIEDNAENIDGLTESQWVAIRAAHRLLGEYTSKEQSLAKWSEEEKKSFGR